MSSVNASRKTVSGGAPGAWISDAYAPCISFTLEDILAGKAEDVSFPSKIKHVPALDPQNIKETYERVQQIFKYNEEMMKQRAGFIDADADDDRAGVPAAAAEEKVNLEDPCIWDAQELAVIRKVSKAAKVRISDLEVQVRETEKRNRLLEADLQQQRERADKLEVELKEACKANKRLKIHVDNVQNQLQQSVAKTELVTDMWKDIDKQRNRLMEEMKELRIIADREKAARGRLELQLDQASSEATQQTMLAVENTKSRYEIHIAKLQKEIAQLQDEIKEYRSTHETTQKALKHMTAHFASLPLRDIVPENVVTTDQLSSVDYVG